MSEDQKLWEVLAAVIQQAWEMGRESALTILYLAGRRLGTRLTSPHVQAGIAPEDLAVAIVRELCLGELELIQKKPEHVYRLSGSRIADAFVRLFGQSQFPVCCAIAGILAAVHELVKGMPHHCEEVACKASGAEFCEFLVYPVPTAVTEIQIAKPLTPFDILALPPELKRTAMVMLALKEAAAEEVAQRTGRSAEEEAHLLDALAERGYLVKRIREGKAVYRVAG